jgi:hypothetical protein
LLLAKVYDGRKPREKAIRDDGRCFFSEQILVLKEVQL